MALFSSAAVTGGAVFVEKEKVHHHSRKVGPSTGNQPANMSSIEVAVDRFEEARR
jgi:hypothetical protein